MEVNYVKGEKEEFENIIKDIISNETVQKMKNFRQHCNISCYEHCYRTAFYCYKICKKFNWDYKAVARASMLHDLFLYDWRVKSNRKGLHAFTHPKAAYDNASRIFKLSKKEKDMIVKHMWPLTITPPKYKESYILTLMDKFSATKESFEYTVECVKKNQTLKYTYVFLAFILMNFYRKGKFVLATLLKMIWL